MDKMSWPISFFMSVVVMSLTILIIEKDIIKLVSQPPPTEPIIETELTKSEQQIAHDAIERIKQEIRDKKCLVDYDKGEVFSHTKFYEGVGCYIDIAKRKFKAVVEQIEIKLSRH